MERLFVRDYSEPVVEVDVDSIDLTRRVLRATRSVHDPRGLSEVENDH